VNPLQFIFLIFDFDFESTCKSVQSYLREALWGLSSVRLNNCSHKDPTQRAFTIGREQSGIGNVNGFKAEVMWAPTLRNLTNLSASAIQCAEQGQNTMSGYSELPHTAPNGDGFHMFAEINPNICHDVTDTARGSNARRSVCETPTQGHKSSNMPQRR
jgi:hypothetical protein